MAAKVGAAMKKLLLGITASTILSACGPQVPADPELTCSSAPGEATLAKNVQAVFTAKCATCHVPGYSLGDYSDAARTATSVAKKSLYAGSTGTLKIVDPGSLANSSLWLKVLGGAQVGRSGPNGENVSQRMPNDDTRLTADEKQLLKDWICTGAN